VYAIRQSDAGKTASAKVLHEHGSRLAGNDRQRRKHSGKKASSKRTVTKVAENQMTFDFDQ